MTIKENSSGRNVLTSAQEIAISLFLGYRGHVIVLRTSSVEEAKRWRLAIKECIERNVKAEKEAATYRIENKAGTVMRTNTMLSMASTVEFRPILWTIRVLIHRCSFKGKFQYKNEFILRRS